MASKLQVTASKLQVTASKLKVTASKLKVTASKLKVTAYIFCATDVFIRNTAMKKVKLIRLFILSFVLQNKHD